MTALGLRAELLLGEWAENPQMPSHKMVLGNKTDFGHCPKARVEANSSP